MKQQPAPSIQYSKSEQGVSLLLAILVLSAILAISFSLATILFAEIRGAGDLMRTEPSVYASYGVTEEAIFKTKRRTNHTIGAQNVGVVQVAAPVESATNTPVVHLVVKPSSGFADAETRIHLYDPNNLYAGSGYGRVRVQYLDTGNTDNLRVYLCAYNPSTAANPCVNPSDDADGYFKTSTPSGDILVRGNAWEMDFAMFPGTTHQQELVLVNSGSSNMYIILETFATNGTTPKGPPFAGETSIEIESNNKGLKRRIQTIIPNN